MIVNKIKEISRQKGLDYIRPSEDQLVQMNISIKMWNKFFHKRSDPQLNQLAGIAAFLGCMERELIEGPTPVAEGNGQ